MQKSAIINVKIYFDYIQKIKPHIRRINNVTMLPLF